MDNYEITLRREVLREKSAEILADFYRYIKKTNIKNDGKNPLLLIEEKIADIHRDIFDNEYSDIKKLYEANGKLDLAKEILKELNEE